MCSTYHLPIVISIIRVGGLSNLHISSLIVGHGWGWRNLVLTSRLDHLILTLVKSNLANVLKCPATHLNSACRWLVHCLLVGLFVHPFWAIIRVKCPVIWFHNGLHLCSRRLIVVEKTRVFCLLWTGRVLVNWPARTRYRRQYATIL